MPASIQRILERRGRVVLIEPLIRRLDQATPFEFEHLGVWRGDDREEAMRQFERIVKERDAEVAI